MKQICKLVVMLLLAFTAGVLAQLDGTSAKVKYYLTIFPAGERSEKAVYFGGMENTFATFHPVGAP